MTKNRQSRNVLKARNAKVQAGIAQVLGGAATIQLAGEQFTPASLEAVFATASAAMETTDADRKKVEQDVLTERAALARAAEVLSALRSLLIGTHGAQALTVLGAFGVDAPRSTNAGKSVATKAVAVAKAKATRAARGTMGPVARKAIVGTVDAKAIRAAIESPNSTPGVDP